MKKQVLGLAVSLPVALFSCLTSHASTITVDGSASDWAGITALGTDADDVSDDSLDIKASYAANDSDNLYLRLDLYGTLNRTGRKYFIYLDTDKNSSTGFTYGWWTTGADYRIYIDEWNIGLQKFMGSSSTDDTWGWNGVIYSLKAIPIAYSQNILECAIPRVDIGEASFPEANNILFRAWPGDDSIPYYNATPLSYLYKINIVPFPQELALKGFNLTIDSSWDIRANTSDTEDMFSAQQLQQELTTKYGLNLAINPTSSISGTKHIILANPVEDTLMQSLLIQRNLCPETTLNEEGYLLEVYSDNMIIASSNTSKGLFYGMQTIRQILAKTSTSTIAYGLKIKDWPDSKMRGMEFCGVNFDPSSVDYVYDKIDKMVKYKMNMADFEANYYNLQTDSWLRNKLIELFDYCRKRYIEPIPEMSTWSNGADVTAKDLNVAEGVWIRDEQFKFVGDVAEPVKSMNLVVNNPGFETDANADGMPDGWTIFAYPSWTPIPIGQDIYWSRDAVEKHNGAYSMKLTSGAGASVTSSVLESNIISVDPNTLYTLSYFAKKTSGSSGSYNLAMRISQFDQNNNYIVENFYGFSTVSAWGEERLNFYTDENCRRVKIWVWLYQGKGTVWVDDLKLERMSGSLRNVLVTPQTDITVTNLAKTTTYIKGVDYNLVRGNLKSSYYLLDPSITPTRIERITTGAIGADETVLVGYDLFVQFHDLSWKRPYCPSDPKTYDIIAAAFTDVHNYLNPKYVNIKMDEVWGGMNRDSRCLSRNLTNAELFADGINQLYNCIRAIDPDIKIMMWDDMLNPWHHGGRVSDQKLYGGKFGTTYQAVDSIPTDIIQMIWWYSSSDSSGKMANSPEYFKSKGFDYLVSPWYDLDNIKNWTKILRDRKDSLGMMDTSWPGTSLRWLGLTPSADYSWLYSRPTAEWHLNENTGSLAYDSSPNANTGTITGATWTEGFLGSSLSFDGNDYVTIAGSEVLNPAALTLEAWVKLPSCQSYPIDIISKYNTGIAGSYLLSILSDGKVYFSIECPWSSITSTQSLSLNIWHHIAVTFDGLTKSIYIDGELDSQNTGGGLSSHTTPVLIGARYYYGSPSNCFKGLIDEARIYDRALTSGEILERYNDLLAEKNKTLVAEYRLDENTGTTAYDSTSNNNDGTITGATWTQGVSNSALQFDGVNDYVEVPHSMIQNPANEITVSLWFKFNGIPTWWNRVLEKGIWTSDNLRGSYRIVTGKNVSTIALQLYLQGGAVKTLWSPTLEINRWYHVVGTYKSNQMSLYINGVPVASDTTVSGQLQQTTSPLCVGANSGRGENFNGAIDEVKIYNRALTGQEVLDEYNSHPVNSIVIDGVFSDWSGITALGTDASGDASGGIVDWTSLWATNSSGNLYLSYSTVSNIDFASNAWRYAIYIDKDNNPSTGFKGMDGSFLIGAEYLIEGGSLHQYNGTGTSWSWLWLSSLSYSFTANRLEMAVPESTLGLSANYTIKIMLLGNNQTTSDYAKNDKSGYMYTK